ncbi:hypothetical protein [Streptomyces griseosporeus]|uniref:hypothetical protein n=1 Tax=Streptomyces griseosporeus TaxID=1910 RepID=UPI0037019A20
MHRTTTTATLLVTVAVSALSGCVTVQRPPASRPQTPPSGASAPSLPSVPRPDGSAEPQIVQAPAREALELAGPSRRAEPDTDDPGPRRPPTPEHPAAPHARTPHTPPHPRPQEQHPGQEHDHDRRPPRVVLPDIAESVHGTVPDTTDACALGRQYGGWRADSAEARACARLHGR